jgi:hypothetical protein
VTIPQSRPSARTSSSDRATATRARAHAVASARGRGSGRAASSTRTPSPRSVPLSTTPSHGPARSPIAWNRSSSPIAHGVDVRLVTGQPLQSACSPSHRRPAPRSAPSTSSSAWVGVVSSETWGTARAVVQVTTTSWSSGRSTSSSRARDPRRSARDEGTSGSTPIRRTPVAAWTVTDSDARTPVSRLGTTTWGRPPTGTNRGAALTATGRVHSPATRATGCTSRTSTSTAAPGGRFATSLGEQPGRQGLGERRHPAFVAGGLVHLARLVAAPDLAAHLPGLDPHPHAVDGGAGGQRQDVDRVDRVGAGVPEPLVDGDLGERAHDVRRPPQRLEGQQLALRQRSRPSTSSDPTPGTPGPEPERRDTWSAACRVPAGACCNPRRPTRLSESSLGDTPAPAERAERPPSAGAAAGGSSEPTAPLPRATPPGVPSGEPTVRLDEPPAAEVTEPRALGPASLEPTVELPPPASEATPPVEPGPKVPRPAAVFTPFRRMFTRGDVPPTAGPDRDGQLPADLVMAGGLVLLGLGAVAAGAAAGTFGWLVTMGR